VISYDIITLAIYDDLSESLVRFLNSRLSMICLRNPQDTWSFEKILSVA
jgi:hypothetical protein